ncbi:MAG: hypothetical protein R3C05_11325 [Pirellulaceae bacterium]
MNVDTEILSRLNHLSDQMPDYAGYAVPHERGKSDRLVRDALAAKLRSIHQHIERALAEQVDQGVLHSLPLGERLKTRIDHLRQTIVSERLSDDALDDLEQPDVSPSLPSVLLNIDHQLIEAASNLEASVRQMAVQTRINPESLQGIHNQIEELQRMFHDRRRLCEI